MTKSFMESAVLNTCGKWSDFIGKTENLKMRWKKVSVTYYTSLSNRCEWVTFPILASPQHVGKFISSKLTLKFVELVRITRSVGFWKRQTFLWSTVLIKMLGTPTNSGGKYYRKGASLIIFGTVKIRRLKIDEALCHSFYYFGGNWENGCKGWLR